MNFVWETRTVLFREMDCLVIILTMCTWLVNGKCVRVVHVHVIIMMIY